MIDGFVSFDVDQAFALRLKELGLSDQYSMEDIFLSKRDANTYWAVEYLKNVMATLDSESLDKIYAEYIATADLRSFVKTLNIPTLAVYGSDDVRVPPTYQKMVANLLPKVELMEIEGAGHFPFLQKDDLALLVNRIKRFCMSLSFPFSAS